MIDDTPSTWTTSDAEELYDVARWGQGYFSIADNGHLRVHPDRQPDRFIDLKDLIDRLQARGFETPVLLRFNGILRDRLRQLDTAFRSAIEANDYQGTYACVYPIKVNQQREVVEKVVRYGQEFGFGLEAGSKPELLAVIAMADQDTPIVCNGFKDAEFIQMALLAQKIGRRAIPVVEKYTELELILKYAEQLDVRPILGMRVKLAARGAGRWQSSGGYRSKFGLRVNEILRGLEVLKSRGMEDCFQLLHFHLGSQITNIRQVKSALNEATRVYCELHKLGAGIKYIDVGGGLGVDYDGSQTDFDSSMNYTIDEYARDVVHHIQTVCDDAEVPHPNIISESGRAVSAFHSVLVFDVLGVSQQGREQTASKLQTSDEAPLPLQTLYDTYNELSSKNLLESFHDAQQAIDEAMVLFATGHMSLDERCDAENIYFSICHRIFELTEELDHIPRELKRLDRLLSDNYFCNFSLFQSIPDSWAIRQLFPIMPIHRLNERPACKAILSDITCDSDGRIDQFIDRRDKKRTLPLHSMNGSEYFLGTFLIGAYQEILGDLHNLFGDTNAVHVELTDGGDVVLDTLLKGESVREVLDYVQFQDRELVHRLQSAAESAVQAGRLSHKEAGQFVRFFEDALNGYTYLKKPPAE